MRGSSLSRAGTLVKASLLAGAALALAGCNHLHVSNRPNPPLPTVLAPQNPFLLDFTVVNSTDRAVEPGEVTAEIRSTHFTRTASVCNTLNAMTSPRIESGGGLWKVQGYSFSESSIGIADPCHCTKARDCWGHVWVKLLESDSGAMIPGPDTHINIYFEGSGTLDDLVINDLSE